MIDHDAAVLDDLDPRRAQALCRRAVLDAQLHPYRPGKSGEGENFVDVSGDVLRGPEQVHDVDRLVDVANKVEGHTICAFGDAAEWPVQSFIKHYRHEFEYMIENDGRSIVEEVQPAAA